MVTDLFNANWIIVTTLDQNPSRPYSLALSRLLAERQDLLRDKRIIVFALGAPYYLDATNISKISAFFALYNHLPSSIDVAARILFNEFPAFPGSLPVSVPGINYDLISATSPDPTSPFTIFIGQSPNINLETQDPAITPTPPVFRVEDQIDLQTSTILDYNGNPVPDGTPVTFYVVSQGTTRSLPQVTTVNGSASSSFFVEGGNNLSIYAESSQARSQTVEISIFGDNSLADGSIPTILPDISPQPTDSIASPSPTDSGQAQINQEHPSLWGEWIISLLIVLVIGVAAYQTGASSGLVSWGIRWSLTSVICGLAAYNYVLLGFPGTRSVYANGVSTLGISLVVLVGSCTGWLMAFLIHRGRSN
jgi:beta-N-acetylhexosaminidase